MGSRDRYTIAISCLQCGKQGTAYWSEWDIPTIYSGSGKRLDSVSEGFVMVLDSQGKQGILCATCRVQAI